MAFEHWILFRSWLNFFYIYACAERWHLPAFLIRFVRELSNLNVFTLKVKIKQNEMPFYLMIFISGKRKTPLKQRIWYVSFKTMVLYVTISVVSWYLVEDKICKVLKKSFWQLTSLQRRSTEWSGPHTKHVKRPWQNSSAEWSGPHKKCQTTLTKRVECLKRTSQ